MLTESLIRDSGFEGDVDDIVLRAARAQESFENWTDGRVDALLFDLARAFAESAERLATATVAETGMGNVLDKTSKLRFASVTIYESLAGKIGQGPLAFDAERQVTEVASPVGVIFAVLPVTHPVETAIFKTLIALKGRNAIILSFHHQALGVGRMAGALIRTVLATHRAPIDVVQCVEKRAGREATQRFMAHPNVSLILATGGAGLVKAAYSSGTPAIGVGPGNAPAWICADAEIERAARSIVASKSFDNGLMCGAEHSMVVDDRVASPLAEALTARGAAILTPDETRLFFERAVDGRSGSLRRALVGQSAQTIAGMAGIARPSEIRLLVIPATWPPLAGFHAGEKLAPVLSMFTVSGEDQGLRLCIALLKTVGAGHTAIIHSTSRARIERFARAVPVGRVLVNTPGAQGCCGMTTGLECSLTLGCGTFGGNSTTDNITYRHLLNIKRVAHHLDEGQRPGASPITPRVPGESAEMPRRPGASTTAAPE